MKVQSKIAVALLGSALGLVSQVAQAEASYGYQSTGTGAVSATAKVNLKINVPKLILLRVGGNNTTVDTITWDMTPSWVTSPGSLTSTGASTNTPWDGGVPTFTAASTTNALTAYAWTNASGASLTVATTTAMAPATGPTMSSITVSSSGSLNHPGTNLGTATPTPLTVGTAYTGNWTYGLTVPSPMTWAAGTYNATVTYTASAL